MQEEAMSGMLFWSIGSGVIWKGVVLVRGFNLNRWRLINEVY
jgi:hypothetical protein